jgi:hypothetical protein
MKTIAITMDDETLDRIAACAPAAPSPLETVRS